MLKHIILSTIIFIYASSTAQAKNGAIRTGQVSVGGNLGMAIASPWANKAFKDPMDPGVKGTLIGRYHHDSALTGLELSIDYFRLGGREFEARSAIASFFWRFLPFEKLHPMLSVGVGYSKTENFFSRPGTDQAIFKARAGLEYEIDPRMDLTLHLDHYFVAKDARNDPHANVFAPSIGVLFYIDAVAKGAPAAASGTNMPQAAAAAIDSDGDGVMDKDDRCPGTPPGTQVNALGCAKKQSFEIKLDLKFQTNTAKFTSSPEQPLNELARIMKENPELRVEIQGHTDTSGSKVRNRELSNERANAVKSILLKRFGISANRLTARGYGSTMPIESNETESGRSKNRRVTARILSR